MLSFPYVRFLDTVTPPTSTSIRLICSGNSITQILMGHILSTVHQYLYLGVELSEDLGWEPHINKAISKANKVLGFMRRNIGKCPQDIKEKAYLTLLRPHLEYSSAVWDPYRKQHINSIEMVQRRAARFATSTYSRKPGTVTNILNTLGWPSLSVKAKN